MADAFSAAVRELWGNPSSVHSAGQRARYAIENARRTLANALQASPAEVVFTSGGTESNNLAILGVARALAKEGSHIITTAIEHPAVLESCRQLEREGFEITFLPPDRSGRVSALDVARHLRPDTVLVSVMHANNETGVIQPLADIARIVREARAGGQKIYLHSDGVQALGRIPVDMHTLKVDLYSVSAHKVHAPKGIGALFVAKGTPLHSILFGGRHERGRRAGTENVPGAVALARAAELFGGSDIRILRDRFEANVRSALDDVAVNGASEARLPNTSNLLFHGVSGEAIVIALDMQGMAVSSGSACSSGSTEPSHVLLAMGLSRDDAKSSVRVSFSRYNTADEVDKLSEAMIACVRKLRKTATKEAVLA